jgi:alkylation response protein AidB-like acyl-CoA dehydrogenase
LDFQLTAEQHEFRDTVAAFVRDEVKPVALAPRRLEPFEKPLLMEQLTGASQLGLRALSLSEANGGAGADGVAGCLVAEALAQGDPDIAVVCAHTLTLAHLLFDECMTPAQRAQYLAVFNGDAAFHLAYAGVDAQAGLAADYHRPRSRALSAAVSASPDGSAWVLNGELANVANAGVAKLFAVDVQTPAGLKALLAPRAAAGMSVTEPACARGGASVHYVHGAPGTVMFKDCVLPAGAELARGAYADYTARVAPLIAAANIGVGQAAFEAAIEYTKLRRQGGRKTIEHQPIGMFLTDMAIKLESARNLAWKAAWTLEHPNAVGDRSVSSLPLHLMARAHAAEWMVSVTERAAECFGAMGVMRDMPLQKYVDDALMFKHAAHGVAGAKLLLAEAIAGHARAGE